MNTKELKLNFLSIQITSYCNLNCRYCYLPNRNNSKNISLNFLEVLIKRLINESLLGNELVISWHAGEPLTTPIEHFTECMKVLNKLEDRGCKLFHKIQTNSTLIIKKWIDFLKKYRIRVGVSLDGPEILHNKNRVYRTGIGSFKKSLAGIKKLQTNNIEFDVISVITENTLKYPRELYHFFSDLGIKVLSFNAEEVEGINKQSSLANVRSNQYENFLDEIYKCTFEDPNPIIVREFDRFTRLKGKQIIPSGIYPLSSLSLSVNGDLSTISPELLNVKHHKYGNFQFGNIGDSLIRSSILESNKFSLMWSDIVSGLKKCKKECNLFKICGGAYQSNKAFEHGSFDATETLACRTSIKAPFNVLEKNKVRLPCKEYYL